MYFLLQMAPVIQRFLVEGSSRVAYAGNNAQNLVSYLDTNLIVLKEKLNETNFDRILTVIWESSAQSLSDTIHLSIEVMFLIINKNRFMRSIILVFKYSRFQRYK